MFGIGYQEMFIILVIALVVFGPARLPELAGQVGRWVREFRQMSADLTQEFEKTVAEADDIKRTITGEVTGMRSQVKSVSDSVKKDLQGNAGTKSGTAAKKPATAAGGVKKLGAATERNASAKKPAVAAAARPKPAPAAPVATKADPLADVSFLDDEPEMPSNGVPIGAANGTGGKVPSRKAPENLVQTTADGNGAAAPGGGSNDALARARRRRATAGYARRS